VIALIPLSSSSFSSLIERQPYALPAEGAGLARQTFRRDFTTTVYFLSLLSLLRANLVYATSKPYCMLARLWRSRYPHQTRLPGRSALPPDAKFSCFHPFPPKMFHAHALDCCEIHH
jgi:hypothetical protein